MHDRKSRQGGADRLAKTPPLRRRLHGLVLAAAALVFGALAVPQAFAAGEPEEAAGKPFTICDDQTYALCFSARCTMFNDVAYCRCDVEHGDSASLTQDYRKGDVCTFNAQGKRNGYMVSTWSAPRDVLEGGDKAIYNCSKETATGAYGQCDGGVCWQASRGQRFPGLGTLDKAEIICACPTITADPATAKIGYEIVGPYPCQNDFFKYCDSATANTDNGSYLYVGAPSGSATYLSKKLYGEVLPFNHCRWPTN
jgi:hypothetical protein